MNKEVTYTTTIADQSAEKHHDIMDRYTNLAREYADLQGEYLRLEKSCNAGNYINNQHEFDKSGESTIPSQADFL